MGDFQYNLNYSSDNYRYQFRFETMISQPVEVFSVPNKQIEITPLTDPYDAKSFNRKLTDLMLLSVQIWEYSSNLSRLELAEKSGIWKVSIDEGRLRTRTLDRYLSIKTLPKKPRWRQVLRTARFVLKEAILDQATQLTLSNKLQAVILHIREAALRYEAA